jgi:hypothetical protein
MDEEMKVADAAVAPEAPEKEVIPEEPKDAQVQEADAPSTSEVDAEKEVSGEDKVGTPDSKWENDKRSMAEKIKALENEKNEYLQAKKMLEALDSAAANDPEFMKLANKKLVEQGLLDESVLEKLNSAPSQSQARPQTDESAKSPAVLWAEQKMREEHEKREKFFVSFEERHPDLTEGSPEVIRANRTAIGAAAAKKMAEGGVSEEEAFEFAYKLIMNPTQLVEEGKLQGIAQAQSASPVEGAASGGAANSSGKGELTPEQREAARLFGITEEAYARNLEE